MPKGEIINFPGHGKELPDDESREDLAELEIEQSELDSELDENQLAFMLLYLAKLVRASGKPSVDSMELRRVALIDPATDQELFTWVNQSEEGNWQAHPTFYHAIFAELKKRDLIPSA